MKHETVRATAFAMPLDFASPEQLGGTVAFLCSVAAEQITGTAISVDGGWTAR
jgi:3-hydroxybutyrate dehydrogenase